VENKLHYLQASQEQGQWHHWMGHTCLDYGICDLKQSFTFRNWSLDLSARERFQAVKI